MTYQDILKQMRSKDFKPLYFLHGDESYFIDAVVEYAEDNILSEAEQSFNQTILYGKEADHLTVVDAARRYPMMAERQVVILKEAQELRTLKDLQGYVENPTPSTVLIIAHKHKKLNFNTKLGKALKKHAVVLDAKKLYDNQIPDWIVDYLKRKKLRIRPDAANLLGEYLGTNLAKIANELNKLAINLPKDTEVTTKHIEENIGISKDYNVFELQKALGTGDVAKANRIVRYFAANPKKNPMPVVLASLYNYFSKVYMLHYLRKTPEKELLATIGLRSAWFLREYRAAQRQYPLPRVTRVLRLLSEYDMKSKGVGYQSTGKPDGELLRELVWRILHPKHSAIDV
jgi:DNA polymerase III subunit delta